MSKDPSIALWEVCDSSEESSVWVSLGLGLGLPGPSLLPPSLLPSLIQYIKHQSKCVIVSVSQCQPMNLENPRLTEDTMRLACMLIRNFDKIERQDPR